MDKIRSGSGKKRLLLKALAAAAAAVIAVSGVPLAYDGMTFVSEAANDYSYHYGDFWYSLDVNSNGQFTASISGYEPADSTAVTDNISISIPQDIGENKYPVTSIAPSAFAGQYKITKVTIPNSVTKIGESAFQSCTGLTDVTIPANVSSIGAYAFLGCTSLKNANIPAGMREIGYEAFMDCSSLEKITIANGLQSLGQYAFAGCTSLTEIKLPDTVETMGASAFEGCSKLLKVELSKNIRNIDDFTFHNCSTLNIITIPEGVESIGSRAFAECTKLASISLPKTLKTVGWEAFYGSTQLSAVTVPYTLNNISDTAFDLTNTHIWGYSGSYAQEYATRNSIPFNIIGAVHRVTFSADMYYATVNDIQIRTKAGDTVVPPASVPDGETLTITVTAPYGYDINFITVNDAAFANGSTFTVNGRDVDVFVSYREKSAQTTTTQAPPVMTTAAPADATTVSGTNQNVQTTPSQADTTARPVDNEDFVTVDSDLEDISAKVRISTNRDYFIGPATIRLTNTPEASDAAREAIEALDTDGSLYYAFDISIYDETGRENQAVLANGTVMFMIPVPNELLPYADSIKVYHIVDDTPELIRSSITEDVSGVKRVQFETDSFSPYVFLADVPVDAQTIDDDETITPADRSDDEISYINEDDDTDTTTPPAVTAPPETEMSLQTDNTVVTAEIVPQVTTVNVPEDIISPAQTGSSEATLTEPTASYNGNLNPHTGAIIAGTAIPAGMLGGCVLLLRGKRRRRGSASK